MRIRDFPEEQKKAVEQRVGRWMGAVVLVILVGAAFMVGLAVKGRGGDETAPAVARPALVVEVTQEHWTMTLQLLVRLEENLAKAMRIIDRQQYTLHLLSGGTKEAWGE